MNELLVYITIIFLLYFTYYNNKKINHLELLIRSYDFELIEPIKEVK